MAKVKLKSRFYILITVISVAVVVLLIVLLGNRGEGVTDMGEIRLELNTKAVLIRDEVCVSSEKFDRIIFSANEGDSVAEGDFIASVFKWGYKDDILQAYLNVQQNILSLQMELQGGAEDAELSALNESILSYETQIRETVMGAGGRDLLELEQELKGLLKKRGELLRGKIQANEALTALYNQEAERDAQLKEWKSDVYSSGSGVLSFYFDGYEQALSASKLELINADLVSNVLRGSTLKDASSPDENYLYRITNVSHWYIAFVSDASDPQRTIAGEQYTVVFDGHMDKPYTGVALEPAVENGKVLNILEFNESIGGVISVRTANVVIKKDAQGVEVPLDSITMVDGVPHLAVITGNEPTLIEVDVLASGGGYAIIRAKNAGDSIQAGQKYQKP